MLDAEVPCNLERESFITRRHSCVVHFKFFIFKTRSGTTNGYRNGTCLTAIECSNKGGSGSGECAGGFGVCCVFMIRYKNEEIFESTIYNSNDFWGFLSAPAVPQSVRTAPT